jgi:protein TonB
MVSLHAQINAAGKPVNLKIASSSGYSLLDKSALSAVKKWEFEPVRHNGKAMTEWVRVPVKFIIQP